jgi:hypothetical protein
MKTIHQSGLRGLLLESIRRDAFGLVQVAGHWAVIGII